jgi:alpha-tubulin suppressor-like RCC1 family protein
VQQGLDLVGDLSGDEFGKSVALSADGNILAIGAPTYDQAVSPGYVKVYHLQDDDWKQMGNDIKGTADKGYFGYSISLSEDGKTFAIGDYYTNENGADEGSVSVYQFDDFSSIWIEHAWQNKWSRYCRLVRSRHLPLCRWKYGRRRLS